MTSCSGKKANGHITCDCHSAICSIHLTKKKKLKNSKPYGWRWHYLYARQKFLVQQTKVFTIWTPKYHILPVEKNQKRMVSQNKHNLPNCNLILDQWWRSLAFHSTNWKSTIVDLKNKIILSTAALWFPEVPNKTYICMNPNKKIIYYIICN